MGNISTMFLDEKGLTLGLGILAFMGGSSNSLGLSRAHSMIPDGLRNVLRGSSVRIDSKMSLMLGSLATKLYTMLDKLPMFPEPTPWVGVKVKIALCNLL